MVQRRPIYGPRYVRGLLSGVFLATVFVASSLSMDAAVSFADDAAQRIRAQCASEGRCPDVPDGWAPIGPGRADARAGVTIRHRLLYASADEGQSFSINLRKNIDDGLTWYGGVRMQVLTPSDPPPPSSRRGPTPRGVPK